MPCRLPRSAIRDQGWCSHSDAFQLGGGEPTPRRSESVALESRLGARGHATSVPPPRDSNYLNNALTSRGGRARLALVDWESIRNSQTQRPDAVHPLDNHTGTDSVFVWPCAGCLER